MFRLSHFAAPAIVAATLFVGGCANTHRDMPGNAQLLTQGQENVSATAPSAGTLYVYDDSSNKNIYTTRVIKGDNVSLDAQTNKVKFNNNTAIENKNLSRSHNYQIYFERDEVAAEKEAREAQQAASHSQGTTVVAPGNNGGTTITQPNGTSTTVVPPQQQAAPAIPPAPAGSGAGTYVRPDGTVIQPNGTTVQPGTNGSTVVTPPAR